MTTPATLLHPLTNKNFCGRTIHIFGALGTEGFAVLVWLVGQRAACATPLSIVAHDLTTHEDALTEWARVHEHAGDEERAHAQALIEDTSIVWLNAGAYATLPRDADIIFVPQSWFRYEENIFLKKYFTEKKTVRPEFVDRVWTITRLYFVLFPGTLIAVTGSDGKTTTTRMIGAIMREHARARGVTCIETGNDRTHTQSLAAIADATSADFLVLEVSDRQLSFGFSLQPDVAVITNVTPNKHMDDYGGFENYLAIKAHLIRFQSPQQWAVLNADDSASRTLLSVGKGMRAWFSLHTRPEIGATVRGGALAMCSHEGCEDVLLAADLQIPGIHNQANALAAIAVAESLDVPKKIIADALTRFEGVAHRLQKIRTWHDITFIEDGAGVNPVNVAATIHTYHNMPLLLLVGGYRSQITDEEMQPFLQALQEPHTVHTLVLFGNVATRLHEVVRAAVSHPPHIEVVEGLVDAIQWIRDEDSRGTFPKPLRACMTPGFESFDQYKDYRARAAHFVSLVNALS